MQSHRNRNRIRHASLLAAALPLLFSSTAQAQSTGTITARAALSTQTVLPFYFGPAATSDPTIDLGQLFVGSVVNANTSYTAISLACQPPELLPSGYSCDLAAYEFLATRVDQSTFIHFWTQSAANDVTSVEDLCVFVDTASDSADCSAALTDSGGDFETESYTVTGTDSATMDHIPITAGAEKLNGGSVTATAAQTTSTKKSAAGKGKKDSVIDSGSTLGLVIGLLAWALIA